MKRTASVVLVLSLALITALLSQPARAANWFKLESEHFIITSDGTEARARESIRQLEAFRSLSLQLLGADANSARSQVKFEVYLFKRAFEMQKVRPDFNDHVAGVYVHCSEGSMAYAETENLQMHNGTDKTLDVVRHEYAHHLMYQYARTYYPMWYVEGFAEFLSTTTAENGEITLGQPPQNRLGILKWHVGKWLSFEDVLKPTFAYAGAKEANAALVESFYAQSWLLTHYMLTDNGRAKRLNAYFERIAKGEDPVAAFEPATGIPVANLQGLLWKYLDTLTAFGTTSVEPAPGSIKLTAQADSANDYLLNASVLRTCPGKPQGEAILAQLRAIDGAGKDKSAEFRLTLARAEILFGDAKTALASLDAHAAEDEAGFEAHYLRGRALLKIADPLQADEQADTIHEAKAEFLKAYRLKKLDAPNLYFLAKSMAHDGVNNSVVNAIRGARALEPNVYDYAIGEAFIDVEVGDRDKAVLALTTLASDPHDQALADKARQAIEAIKAGKSRKEVSALWENAAR